MRHHDLALERYLDSVVHDPATLAVIVVGSYARGTARADSDIDLYLVVDDDRFAAATAANRVAWVERQDLDYAGGYIDIKLVSPGYLHTAARSGDDPTRASFEGARVVFSRHNGLESVVAGMTAVPEDQWERRMHSYLAQARIYGAYFLVGAIEQGDAFLTRHAAIHCATAAARAVLTANRTLFRGPKYLTETVRCLPDKPPGFVSAWDAVIASPSVENAETLIALVDDWTPWPLAPEDTLPTFILDNELAWLHGGPPAEYF